MFAANALDFFSSRRISNNCLIRIRGVGQYTKPRITKRRRKRKHPPRAHDNNNDHTVSLTFSNSSSFFASLSTFPLTSDFAGLNATPNASNTGRNKRQERKKDFVRIVRYSSSLDKFTNESTIGLIMFTSLSTINSVP